MSAKRPNDCEGIEESERPEAKKQKTIDSYFSKNQSTKEIKIVDNNLDLTHCDNDLKEDNDAAKDNKNENSKKHTEEKLNYSKIEEVDMHSTCSNKMLDSHKNFSDEDRNGDHGEKKKRETSSEFRKERDDKESTHKHRHKHKHKNKHKKDSKDKERRSSDKRKQSPETKGHRNSSNDRDFSRESLQEKSKHNKHKDSEEAQKSKSSEKGTKDSPNDKKIHKDHSSSPHKTPKKLNRDEDSEKSRGSKSPEKKSNEHKYESSEHESGELSTPRKQKIKRKHHSSEDESGDYSTPQKLKSKREHDSSEDESGDHSTPRKLKGKRKHDYSDESGDNSTPRKYKSKRKHDSTEYESGELSSIPQKLKNKRKQDETDWKPPYHNTELEYDVKPQKPKQSGQQDFEFFYGMKSPFSQFHPAKFEKDGKHYNCAEQYMMYQKAITFNDMEYGKKILKETKPLNQKRLGRKVRGFDPAVWGKKCVDVVKDGNIAKFSQNAHLKIQLFNTHPKILAESSPRDCLWGIGLSPSNPKAWDVKTWRGKNLLGYALMEVRTFLMQQEGLIE